MNTLTINSYPKSGAAILQHILQTMYPLVKVSEISDDLFDFSNFNETEQGVICILRNPTDSISNAYLRDKIDRSFYANTLDPANINKPKLTVSDFVKNYLDFYKHVLDNKENTAVIDFEQIGVATYTEDIIKAKFNIDADITVFKKDTDDYITKQGWNRISPTSEELAAVAIEVQEDPRYLQCLAAFNAVRN